MCINRKRDSVGIMLWLSVAERSVLLRLSPHTVFRHFKDSVVIRWHSIKGTECTSEPTERGRARQTRALGVRPTPRTEHQPTIITIGPQQWEARGREEEEGETSNKVPLRPQLMRTCTQSQQVVYHSDTTAPEQMTSGIFFTRVMTLLPDELQTI